MCLGTVANTPDRGKLRFFYGNAMRTNGSPFFSGTDNNSNVTQVEHVIPSASTYRDQYDYDALNRITQARDYWVNGSTTQLYQQSYTLDAWGNRTINAASTWGGVNAQVFTVPAVSGVPTTNRFTELSYDLAGNVITDGTAGGAGNLTFDAENRMTRAITGVTTSYYVYDGDGRRVRRIVGGVETWHVYGFEGELLAEYPVSSGAPASAPQREYGYRGGEMLVVAGCDVARWLVKDHLGTPRMLPDVTGLLANQKRHDYLPYGEEVPASLRSSAYGYAADCVRQDFTTYERDDETGLDYAQARYYASKQGRFIGVDPMNASGVSGVPQSWNRYNYVGNNPLAITDPSGLIWAYHREHGYKWFTGDKLSEEDTADGWTALTSIELFYKVGNTWYQLNPRGPHADADPSNFFEWAGWAPVNGTSEGVIMDGGEVPGAFFGGMFGKALTGMLGGALGRILGEGSEITTLGLSDTVSTTAARTVFEGHGTYELIGAGLKHEMGTGIITVPQGTSVTVYSRFGNLLREDVAQAAATGQDLPAGAFSKTFAEGMRMPNYTLHPVDGVMRVQPGSVTVAQPTRLGDLLKPNMGGCHWVACTAPTKGH